MKNKVQPSSHSRESIINTIGTIATLALIPLVGLFLLPRRALKWKLPVKIIAAGLTLLYLQFWAGTLMWLFWAGGIHYLGPHDTQALQYLESRYHEKFIIGKSMSGDQLGGSNNYNKLASPKDNPELEFSVSKCLANCQPSESTRFSDTYPQKKWTHQLTQRFKQDLALTDKQTVRVYANTQNDTTIVNAHNGAIPDFYNLSPEERELISIGVWYNESEGSYTQETREQHANQILKIVSLLRDAGATASSLTYDIKATTPSTAIPKHSRDQFHFKSDQPLNLTTPSDIYPLFVVHTYGRGVNKKGHQLHQVQLNTSKGQSAGNGRVRAIAATKAKQELIIANDIRNQIATNYLVAPLVTAIVNLNDNTELTTDYNQLAPDSYTVSISVYNYPNDTIPVSIATHRNNVINFTQLLKGKFTSSNLSYKIDSSTCDVESISNLTASENVAVECFKN